MVLGDRFLKPHVDLLESVKVAFDQAEHRIATDIDIKTLAVKTRLECCAWGDQTQTCRTKHGTGFDIWTLECASCRSREFRWRKIKFGIAREGCLQIWVQLTVHFSRCVLILDLDALRLELGIFVLKSASKFHAFNHTSQVACSHIQVLKLKIGLKIALEFASQNFF